MRLTVSQSKTIREDLCACRPQQESKPKEEKNMSTRQKGADRREKEIRQDKPRECLCGTNRPRTKEVALDSNAQRLPAQKL